MDRGEKDRLEDDRRWAIATEFVQANHNYSAVTKLVELWSPEERKAWDRLIAAKKELNRMQRKDKERAARVRE